MTVLTRVTIEEAAADLSRLIEQVRQGEEVVIAQDGVEVARIVVPERVAVEGGDPAAGENWRTPGMLAGLFVERDPNWWKPDDELADLFEGSDSFEGVRGNWLKTAE